jgi:steroid delta-isomerase-like uncharacterized protein
MPRITGQSRNDTEAGGGTATKERAPSKPKQTKKQVEALAKSYFAAVAGRDLDSMLSHWHEDGVEDLVAVGVLRGHGELREFFGENFRAVPDWDMTVDRIVADTSTAVGQWRLTGTFSGAPFQGIEPTGKRIQLRGCDILEIEDGKIRHNTVYYDGADFARQIGLMPPKDSGAEKALFAAFNAATKVRAAVRERRGQ